MSAERVRNNSDIFARCIARLEESVQDPALDNRDRAGIVKHFELAFEQAYKCIVELLIAIEAEASKRSVKVAFRNALEFGWIRDEPAWLGMIEDRNALAHTYDEPFAVAMIERIGKVYLPQFRLLHQALVNEISKI